MERLRNFAPCKYISFPFQLPAFASRRNLFEETGGDNAAHFSPSPAQLIDQDIQESVEASFQASDMSTQSQSDAGCPRDQPMDQKNEPVKAQIARNTAKKGLKKAAIQRRLSFGSHMLALVDILIVKGDAVASSGLAVSQRLNDTAREILEAKMIQEKIDGDITQLTNQLETMELRFNSAYVQFSKARAVHHTALDYRRIHNHKENALADLMNCVELIKQMIQDTGVAVSEWPISEVHNVLSKVDQLQKHNKSLYNFNLINQIICAIMDRFRGVKFHKSYDHLLLVGVDSVDFIHNLRKENHGTTCAR